MKEAPRALLQTLRDFLNEQSAFAGDSPSLGAAAIAGFLDGTFPTLDHAFGLVEAPHRGKDTARRLELARRIEVLRGSGQSWQQVIDSLGDQGLGLKDERAIRRLYAEFQVALIAEALERRLANSTPGQKNEDF